MSPYRSNIAPPIVDSDRMVIVEPWPPETYFSGIVTGAIIGMGIAIAVVAGLMAVL